MKICKGKKFFHLPDQLDMKKGSRQYSDQIRRLIANKQIEEEQA